MRNPAPTVLPMAANTRIEELLGKATTHGASALTDSEFREVVANDTYDGLILDASRMLEWEFDLAVNEVPITALEVARWRMTEAQYRFCLLEEPEFALMTRPAGPLPPKIQSELCFAQPDLMLRYTPSHLTPAEFAYCAQESVATALKYSSDRFTDEEIMAFLETGEEEVKIAIMQFCPARISKDLLLSLAIEIPLYGYHIKIFTDEELSLLIDATLDTAMVRCPPRMTGEQMRKGIQQYPGVAIAHLDSNFFEPGEMAFCIDKEPGRAINKYFSIMTPEQIERAVVTAQYIDEEILAALPDRLFDLSLRTDPAAGSWRLPDRITSEQLLFLAENFPEDALITLPASPTDLISQEVIDRVLSVALEKEPGQALRSCYADMTPEQRDYCARKDPECGIERAPDVFSDEEFAALAQEYPNEAKRGDYLRYMKLGRKFVRTTRGRDVPAGLMKEVSWTTQKAARDELEEAEAASPQTVPLRLAELATSSNPYAVLAVAKNLSTDALTLEKLTFHPFGAIQDAALKNPNIPLGVVVDCARWGSDWAGGWRLRDDSWFLPAEIFAGRLGSPSQGDARLVLRSLIEVADTKELVERGEAAAADALKVVSALSHSQKVALENVLAKEGATENFTQAVEIAKEMSSPRSVKSREITL